MEGDTGMFLDRTLMRGVNRRGSYITARVDDEIEKDMPRIVRMPVIAKDHSGRPYEVHTVNSPGH
jgi:hypothetical protein